VVIPVVNSAASPLRFEMDPQGQYNALKAIEDDGKEMLAIYHSHTRSPAYPSQTDINLATYPDSIYLIVSLAEGEDPLRGFRIDDGAVTEVELTVV
jgi:[CysO sulfur-carrier protein]-S-L-cysteine hydrolase